jgi:hypothetical protein
MTFTTTSELLAAGIGGEKLREYAKHCRIADGILSEQYATNLHVSSVPREYADAAILEVWNLAQREQAESERLRAAVATYVELNESKWEDVDEDHIGHILGQRFRVAETALYDILDAAHAPHSSQGGGE